MIKFKKIFTGLLATVMVAQMAFSGGAINVNAASGGIPKDAQTYNGNKYYVFYERMNWSDAKKYCEKLGGHLVTITSQKEQDFVDNKLNSRGTRLWIGAYRANGKSNVWKWVTGEKWKYTNWDDGEPNDSSNVISNENRGSVWPHKWNDLNDSSREQSGFICEWETRAATIKTVKISKIKKKSAVLKITPTKKTSKFEVIISTDPNFTKTVKTKSKSPTVSLKNLKSKKTYYVKVRAYKNVGNTQVSGKWSKIYYFKTK